MKRISRIWLTSRPTLLCAVVTLALTSASVAAASDGPGPFGVTAVADVTVQNKRVGALFDASRVGKLAGGHFCSASVVRSPQHTLIATAAHCVDDDDEDLVFVPGYRDGKAPYGVWKVGKRFLPDEWAKEQSEDSDIAFAYVEELDGKRIQDVLGGNRFVPGVATGATAVTVTGYPDTRDEPVTCTNKPTQRGRTQQRIDCPEFTGGTSGSPWINGNDQVVGILGGHDKGGTTADTSYSVVLRGDAAKLYQAATAGR
ncbi:trypsin-like serine peptidase [Streptomyces griseochromogenes]|uniref:trypsin-like serine peptidase n=1 Tax=Streptomyces griseochromogenes TaxID=68214 RepID=UPI003790A3FF